MNILNINKKNNETVIAVAMSGGVDSSVVAALLKDAEYKVIGITLKLFEGSTAENTIADAKKIADQLEIEHYVLDCVEDFKTKIIDNFVGTYLKGETPLPCAHCNKHIKFGALLDFAKELGADAIATGHYVKKIINDKTGKAEMHRADDLKKDQSYFLFAVTQEQLEFTIFPLGKWSKDITRAKAEEMGLIVAQKPDSQDICFVPNNDYANVVKARASKDTDKPGDIVHIDGRVLGKHKGIIHYTIGQRRGLGIGGGVTEDNAPLFVVDIKADENKIIVGEYSELAKNKIFIDDTNWLEEIPDNGLDVEVKLRSVQKAQSATLFKNQVILKEPAYGIAKGQACVAYQGSRLIGGGWITGAEKV